MTDDKQLGDAPIERAHREKMNYVARVLDDFFNGAAAQPQARGHDLETPGRLRAAGVSVRREGRPLQLYLQRRESRRHRQVIRGADQTLQTASEKGTPHMSEHELKIWPNFFNDIVSGRRTFDVRRDDRNFKPGDTIMFKEWEPKERGKQDAPYYTGRTHRMRISYILDPRPGRDPDCGLVPGYVVMGLMPVAFQPTIDKPQHSSFAESAAMRPN
jgi:hypothetical protein